MTPRPALLVFSVALVTQGVAHAANPAFTWGPIVGRGESGDQMIVKWGTSASSLSTLSYRKVGDSAWSNATGNDSADHEVVLGGLSLGTAYEYSFDASASFAKIATCPAPGAPIDVVFYGDNRPKFLGTSQHATVLAAVSSSAPDLVVSTGDLTLAGTALEMTTGFLPELVPLVHSTPYMAAPGNHDATVGLDANYGRFMPTPRPAADAWRPYYAFVCSNAMFISLNSNAVGDAAQLTFLNGKLAAAQADASIDWVFVYFHHAPYSVGTHGDTAEVQATWVPIFDAAPKVAAVFSGHDHIYGRFTNGGHVAYFVSGGAGADLYNDTGTTTATKVTSKKAYHFVKAHIAGKGVRFDAFDPIGTTLDTLALGTQGAPPDMGGTGADLGAGGADLGAGGTGDAGTGGTGGGDDEHGCGFAPRRASVAPLALFGLAFAYSIARRRRD